MWGSLPRLLDRVTTYYADRTAIIDGPRSLSYSQLAETTHRVSNALLGAGLRRGERVGILMPNCLEFIPTLYGVLGAGGAVTQLPARASAEDFRYFLNASESSFLIHHESFAGALDGITADCPSLRTPIRVGSKPPESGTLDYSTVLAAADPTPPGIEISGDDLAFIGFTSGTTGIPKGVLQTHTTWLHYAVTAGLEISDTRPGEVFAHGAPLTHFSQSFVMPTFMRGGTNVMLPSLDLDTLLTAVATHRVSATALVPTVIYLLLGRGDLDEFDLSSLQTIIYAGSPMSPAQLDRAVQVLGPVFVQAYAGSEPGYISCLRKEDHLATSAAQRKRLASAGRPMYHVDVSIRGDDGTEVPPGEPGEIWVRQDGQMVGYLDPATNADAMRHGWVRSGDIGHLDDDGFLYIVDRVKDMIVTGGFNVFPRQVEDILNTHPGVRQCAVIGVPDPKWGEAVRALIVADPDLALDEADLIDRVRRHKGGVWAPKSIEFVTDLPLNASGKVDKKQLRQRYWTAQDRQVN